MLIAGLPPESMLKTAIRDGMSVEEWQQANTADPARWGPWSLERHMHALAIDALARIEWTLVAVNSEKGKAPKPPEPMSRPGVGAGPISAVAAKQRTDSLMAIAELKARQRAMGAQPTPEQVQAVLDELMGGDGDE